MRGSVRSKLPILEIDGTLIPDSTDIALEIERRHPIPPLLPSDPAARALVLALEDWADESLYFYEMTTRFSDEDFERNLPKLTPGIPEKLRSQIAPMIRESLTSRTITQGTGRRSAERLARDVDRLFAAIEDMQAKSGFVVGSVLSLADISIICQAECIGDSTIGRSVLDRRPRLANYFARIDRLTFADRV